MTYSEFKKQSAASGIIPDHDPRISKPGAAILYPLTEGAVNKSSDAQKRTLATYDMTYKPWQEWFYGQKGYMQKPTGQPHPATGKPVMQWVPKDGVNKPTKPVWSPRVQRVAQAAKRYGDITETTEQALQSGPRGLTNAVLDRMVYDSALPLAEAMRGKGKSVDQLAYELAKKQRPSLPAYYNK